MHPHRIPNRIGAASALVIVSLAVACTGLVAGNQVSNTTPAQVPRDTAYARARRALQAEVFTFQTQDSVRRQLSAIRYPSASTKAGDPIACRLHLTVAMSDGADQVDVTTTGLWTAPQTPDGRGTAPCDQELTDVMGRIENQIAPTQ